MSLISVKGLPVKRMAVCNSQVFSLSILHRTCSSRAPPSCKITEIFCKCRRNDLYIYSFVYKTLTIHLPNRHGIHAEFCNIGCVLCKTYFHVHILRQEVKTALWKNTRLGPFLYLIYLLLLIILLLRIVIRKLSSLK